MIEGDIGPVLAFGAIAVALALYVAPRVSMELASLSVLCLLLRKRYSDPISESGLTAIFEGRLGRRGQSVSGS